MPIRRTPVKPPELITIPAGAVMMGTSEDQVWDMLEKEDWAEDWYSRDLFQVEQPQHLIEVPTFEIGKFPVTNADYHIFVWETAHRVPRTWVGFHHSEEEANNPVVAITREDALAYCKWLSGRIGGKQYRLPTESEWERAARGDDERIYPWGNDFEPWRCNTLESARRATSPVGLYSPSGDSPYGVTDMAGNVWEWTSTLLKPYPYSSKDGRETEDSSGPYVVRGGSWYYTRKLARVSCREGVLKTFISPALGFRLARDV